MASRRNQFGAISVPPPNQNAAEIPILRLLTCGSVDDGKSTLIGRLLYECKAISEDMFADITMIGGSAKPGEVEYDLSLLLDGLRIEREQKITIDVAYRQFATAKRRFIIADAPGHEQYTRNMVTGSSGSDLAIILVDARKGLLPQTYRHTCLVHLLGIKQVVLAVNKMDLVDFNQATFSGIEKSYREFAAALALSDIVAIPVSALTGDNLVAGSARTRWYTGPSLLAHLENVDVSREREQMPFRMPVQWVCRPNQDHRGYAGTIVSGQISVNDEIVAMPSGSRSKVARIPTWDGDLATAEAGQAVQIVLTDDIAVGRGDVLCQSFELPEVVDQFAADVVWFSEHPLLPGRPYEIRCNTQTVAAQITDVRYKLNVENLNHIAGRSLELNEIGVCTFSTARPIVMSHYADNRDMGGFIIIDRISNETAGAGMIRHALRRSTNIRMQPLNISKLQRARIKGQRACCIWLTGLSGSGKSTLANLLEKELHERGQHTYILDGDNVRHGLNRDLGFGDTDRVENIRRIAEVAHLMVDAGLIVLVSFISPFRAEREFARERFESGEFFEIFVDTPLEVCEARDPKGLYRKARAGLLPNFTGISSPYEPPLSPDLRLAAGSNEPAALAAIVMRELEERKII
jgi:bifunctional enzyme CysN/CysC